MSHPIKLQTTKNILPEKMSAVSNTAALKQDSSHSAARQDMATVSKNWQSRTNWTQRAQETLELLQQSYPNITILISENLKDGTLPHTAAALGSGTHLILSEDFLTEMGLNQANFEKYRGILGDILKELSDSSAHSDGNGAYLTKDSKTFWTANHSDTLPQSPDSTLPFERESAPQKDYRIRTKTVYTVSGAYAKLAGARNKLQVNTAMNDARRNIGSLRLSASYGDEDERKKARAAISSYNKLLLRGNQKLRRLNREEILHLQKKRAVKEENRQKAMQIKAELARKRAARNASDSAIAQEGRMEDANRYYLYKKQYASMDEHSHDYIPPPVPIDIPSGGLLSIDTVQAFTPGEIMVSEASPL